MSLETLRTEEKIRLIHNKEKTLLQWILLVLTLMVHQKKNSTFFLMKVKRYKLGIELTTTEFDSNTLLLCWERFKWNEPPVKDNYIPFKIFLNIDNDFQLHKTLSPVYSSLSRWFFYKRSVLKIVIKTNNTPIIKKRFNCL